MNPQWSNQQQQQPRLQAQPTGYHPQQQQQQPMMTGGFMRPQPTGFYAGQQPQLGSFSAVPSAFVSTFMPANQMQQQPLQPMHTGYPAPVQQMQQQQPLPQFFAQHNQQVSGQAAVQVQWALTNDERRKYDQIFRAWDNGTGYITGQRALEVFRESGLERDDLMKIWALADRENRGKLNLAEFHVAMGLIYRRLSGNAIPDVLPQELVPPSSRDLNQSVDFLKDLLRNDTNARSTNLDPASASIGARQSPLGENKYAKVRSFNAGAAPDPTSSARKDATGYKHDDGQVKSYKSSSRHLDRRNVRFQGEDEDDELAGMRRDLQSTQQMLDSSMKDEDEDEDLKAEIEDLKYRIRRVKDDIEYNKTGRRTEAKDEERRRLERELLFLMHDKLPELEEKMRNRDRTKRSSDRAAARKRDARNNSSRYNDSRAARRGDSDSDDDEDGAREPERGYLRGSYGRDSPQPKRSNGASPSVRDTSDLSKARSIDAPAPPPPVAQQLEEKVPPPPPAPPAAAAAAPARKPQTAEERQAFIRTEAQRRVQERMRVLTGQSPSSTPPPETRTSVDSSVQDRIEQDKREAAERAANEDKAVQERERLRQLRLEEEKLGNLKKEEKQLADTSKALEKVGKEVTAAEMNSSGGDRTVADAARAELDAEERRLREREAELEEEKRKRRERVQQLEKEAADAKQAEADFLAKKASVPVKGKAPPPVPISRSAKAAPKPPPSRTSLAQAASAMSQPTPARNPSPKPVAAPAAPTPPPAPAAPPMPSASPAAKASGASTNPFHRLGASPATAPSAPAASSPASAPRGSNNPFFRPPTGAATSPAPAVAQPVPVRPPPPKTQPSDDWGDDRNTSGDDSSDDDDNDTPGQSVQQKRAGLAGLLFGGPGSAPTSRPGSAKPEESGTPGAPAPPRAPAAPLPKL